MYTTALIRSSNWVHKLINSWGDRNEPLAGCLETELLIKSGHNITSLLPLNFSVNKLWASLSKFGCRKLKLRPGIVCVGVVGADGNDNLFELPSFISIRENCVVQ